MYRTKESRYNKMNQKIVLEKAKTVVKNLYSIWNEPGVALLPAHLAYFIVLSLFPILITLFFAAQFFSLPIDTLTTPLKSALPDAVSSLLAPSQERASNLGVGIWLVVALFIGSNGMNAVIRGSDSLYEFETENYVKRRLRAFLLTLLLVILILLGIAFMAISEYLIGFITGNLHGLISVLRWILLAFLMFVGVKYVYMVTPHQGMSSRYTNGGSCITVFGWIGASALYSFYTAHFSNYDALYGTLANLIVLMIFVYILSIIFVIGMTVNVAQYRKKL